MKLVPMIKFGKDEIDLPADRAFVPQFRCGVDNGGSQIDVRSRLV